MGLKAFPIRFEEQEKELIQTLADLLGVEKTTAIKMAVKESLEQRGVEIPEGLFGKSKEGRPNAEALTEVNQQSLHANETEAISSIALVSAGL